MLRLVYENVSLNCLSVSCTLRIKLLYNKKERCIAAW